MAERVKIAKSTSMVMVACKLPLGLWLQLYEMVPTPEMTPQGTRMQPTARKKGNPIKLAGCALKFGQIPESPMPGGYSLTQVPADFWEEWLEQNQEADYVVNRLIFSEGSMESTSARAQEQHAEKVKSGLEPIDPKKPPPVGMKITPAEKAA